MIASLLFLALSNTQPALADPIMTCNAQIAQKEMIDQLLISIGDLYSTSETAYICQIAVNKGTVTGVGDNLKLAMQSVITQCEVLYARIYRPGDCSATRRLLQQQPAQYCRRAQILAN